MNTIPDQDNKAVLAAVVLGKGQNFFGNANVSRRAGGVARGKRRSRRVRRESGEELVKHGRGPAADCRDGGL